MKLDDLARRAADSVNRIAHDHPIPAVGKRALLRRQRLTVGLAAAVLTLLAIGAAVILPGSGAELPPAGSTTTMPNTPTTQLPTSTTLIPSVAQPRPVRVATPSGVINLPGGEPHPASSEFGAACCMSIVDDGNGGVFIARPIELSEDGIIFTDTPHEVTWLPRGADRESVLQTDGRVTIHELVTIDGEPHLVAVLSDAEPADEPRESLALVNVTSGDLTRIAEIGQIETSADAVTYSDGLFVVTMVTHSSSEILTVDLDGVIDYRSFPRGEGEVHFALPYVGATFSPDGGAIAVVEQEWVQDPNAEAGRIRVDSADLLLLDRDGHELNRWRVFTNDFDDVYDQVVAIDYDGRFVMIAANEFTTDPDGDGFTGQSRIYWVDTAGDEPPSSAAGYDGRILDLNIASGREPTPSQSPSDAARDGVIAEVAALPFEQRVNEIARFDILDEGQGTAYVLSRMNVGGVTTLGTCPPAAECLYGRDFIAPGEYGEVLLIAGDEILRAYPFPGYPPQQLIVAGRSVYCLRQGDGGLPDSMICRIDRDTGETIARIFPFTDSFRPEWTPDNWMVEDTTPFVLFQELVPRLDGSVVISGQGGARFLDPSTLEIVSNACEQGEQFGFVRSFDGTSFVYDDAEWLTGEEANQAAVAAGDIEEGDTVPNDYYIRNDGEETRTLLLADDALVCMSTTQYGGVSDQVLTVQEFLAEIENLDRNRWITDPLINGSWVDEADGVVTRLVVQYQP